MERIEETNGEIDMNGLYIAWSEDQQSAAPKTLREWIGLYPRQADALIGWSCDAPLLDYADTLPDDPAGEARVREIGLKVVAEMRAKYFAASQSVAAPPVSLLAAAKAQGLTLKILALRIGVGLSVASKLDRRLVNAGTVPAECVRRMADALNLTAAQVQSYLQQGPTLAAGAMYKAAEAPQVAEKQDFAAAIQSASDMREEEKALWLSNPLGNEGEENK